MSVPGDLAASYNRLTEMYPARCRRFNAICPRITGHLIKVCTDAEIRDLNPEETLALNEVHVSEVDELCVDGQTATLGLARRISCGINKSVEKQ